MTADLSAAATVVCAGECMVEITRHGGAAEISYAGDTYNTAVYLNRIARLLRLPLQVRYLTGVGDDGESRRMRRRWADEGIVDDAIVVPGRTAGLYLVATDEWGERSFTYWRRDSAAASLFQGTSWLPDLHGDLVYLSGITLQLMSDESRAALVGTLAAMRSGGTKVAFDSNYRPAGWPDAGSARAAVDAVLRVTDIALVSLQDEQALGGVIDAVSCARRLSELGVEESVIKDGPAGVVIAGDGQIAAIAGTVVAAIDTTAAGDSFNGAYLAGRIAGFSPAVAAELGNETAAVVVQHPGAIVPVEVVLTERVRSDVGPGAGNPGRHGG